MFCFRIFVSFSLSVFPVSPPSPSLCCHGAPPLDAQINLPSVSHCLMLPSLCCCDDEVMCILLSLSLGHFFPSQSRLVVTCSRVFILRPPPRVLFIPLDPLFFTFSSSSSWVGRERCRLSTLLSFTSTSHFYPSSRLLSGLFVPDVPSGISFSFRLFDATCSSSTSFPPYAPDIERVAQRIEEEEDEVRLFVKVAFCARWLRMSPIRSVFN